MCDVITPDTCSAVVLSSVVIIRTLLYIFRTFPDETSVLALGFCEIHFPTKMRLIVQSDLYMFFSSTRRIS